MTSDASVRPKSALSGRRTPLLWAVGGCLAGAALASGMTYAAAAAAAGDGRILTDVVTGHAVSATGASHDRLAACDAAMLDAGRAMNHADAAMASLNKGVADYLDPAGFAAGGTAKLITVQMASSDRMAAAQEDMARARVACAGSAGSSALGR